MQAILDLLESNQAYKHFVFDRQTIVWEDYLELFPQDPERIQSLVFEANERPCTGLPGKGAGAPGRLHLGFRLTLFDVPQAAQLLFYFFIRG